MSFTDLMSSSRGPGVIGMVFALIVLLGFGLLFVFAFDEGMQGADRSIESILRNQSKSIEKMTERVALGNKSLAKIPSRIETRKSLGVVQQENIDHAALIERLKQAESSVTDEIAGKEHEFDAYKDEYRAFARSQAKGRKLETLETRSGEVFKAVTFRKVSAIGIQIRHEAGLKRIAFEDLSDELQDHFQFDPKQKAEAIAREKVAREKHELAVQAANSAADEKAEDRRASKMDAARKMAARQFAVNRTRISLLDREIRSLQLALPGESHKSISRAPQMERQLANKKREVAKLREENSQLRSKL